MGEPHQAVGQIYFIEKEILDKRKYLGGRYLSFNYEDFCENPDVVYEEIKNKVSKYSVNLELPDYDGPEYFLQSNPISKEDDFLIEAYKQFRSEEHTSELQSRGHLVCRLLLEKKNKES